MFARADACNLRMRVRMVRYNGDENCSICFDKLCTTRFVKRLPCGHMYHAPCIKKWKKKSCPLCRYNFKYKSIHSIYYEYSRSGMVFTRGCCNPETIDDYWSYWESPGMYAHRVYLGRQRSIFKSCMRELRRKARRGELGQQTVRSES